MQENNTAIPETYKTLPVVGKCCAPGEAFLKNGSEGVVCTVLDPSLAENFSPFFHDFNRSGYEVPGEKQDSFVAIVGDPCKYKK